MFVAARPCRRKRVYFPKRTRSQCAEQAAVCARVYDSVFKLLLSRLQVGDAAGDIAEGAKDAAGNIKDKVCTPSLYVVNLLMSTGAARFAAVCCRHVQHCKCVVWKEITASASLHALILPELVDRAVHQLSFDRSLFVSGVLCMCRYPARPAMQATRPIT